jgi:TonB family protein
VDTNEYELVKRARHGDAEAYSILVGKPVELPHLQKANVRMSATLLQFDNTSATYRVMFRQGDKILADSTASVARGGRAVVGGVDGDAAPYIFVFIEPEAPGKVTASPNAISVTDGITEPKPVATVQPNYPAEAKKEKIEGVVVLNLVIDTEGGVQNIAILEDPDPRLTKAAVDAVKQWKFSPALDRKGNPVSVRSAITIRFRLK